MNDHNAGHIQTLPLSVKITFNAFENIEREELTPIEVIELMKPHEMRSNEVKVKLTKILASGTSTFASEDKVVPPQLDGHKVEWLGRELWELLHCNCRNYIKSLHCK